MSRRSSFSFFQDSARAFSSCSSFITFSKEAIRSEKAEKRFLSTIARRLDTLGAITRGQRQTGGQGLFRPEDNLESQYARDALRQLYRLLFAGKVEGCSLLAFEEATGLSLRDDTGLKDELPPITTFLNRMLALTIDLQNTLFTAFEDLLTARIEGAIASGTYELGLETLQAESFTIIDRNIIYTHPGTTAETRLLTIERKDRNRPITLDDALDRLSDPRAVLMVNAQSGRAAVQDLFHGPEKTRVMAFVGMAMGLCPPSATLIGGTLHVAWGWQSNFVLIAGLAVAAMFQRPLRLALGAAALFLAIDAVNRLDELDGSYVPAFTSSLTEATTSIARIRRLAWRAGADVVAGHDPDQWRTLRRAPE